MYCFGEATQFGHYFGAHPELAVETEAAAGYSSVGNGGHADAAASHSSVVVEQLLAWLVARTHVFESCGPDGAVAKGDRTYLAGSENLRFGGVGIVVLHSVNGLMKEMGIVAEK